MDSWKKERLKTYALTAKKIMFTNLLPVFEHVLYDVVSVLVLDQLVRVGVDLLQDRGRLLRGAVLQDPLDHAAAVRVGREREYLWGVKNK